MATCPHCGSDSINAQTDTFDVKRWGDGPDDDPIRTITREVIYCGNCERILVRV